MTRDEALLKLLSIEPETKDRLIVATGWPAEETESVLGRLLADGRVTYTTRGPGSGYGVGRRRYYPATEAT